MTDTTKQLAEALRFTGSSRDADHPRALIAYFNREPTDDELRAFHESCRASLSASSESGAGDRRRVLDTAVAALDWYEAQMPANLARLTANIDARNDLAALSTRDAASESGEGELLTTCNCRWNTAGEQVQQCTLHNAHVEAIHEWAERAKTAEAALSTRDAASERAALRSAQSNAVMPLIGPLLDAWDGLSNDEKGTLTSEQPELVKHLRAINRAMETDAPASERAAPDVMSAEEQAGLRRVTEKTFRRIDSQRAAHDAQAAIDAGDGMASGIDHRDSDQTANFDATIKSVKTGEPGRVSITYDVSFGAQAGTVDDHGRNVSERTLFEAAGQAECLPNGEWNAATWKRWSGWIAARALAPSKEQAGTVEGLIASLDKDIGKYVTDHDGARYMRDDLRSLAALASREAQQWQPIETAPKDGTHIIALRMADPPHVEGMYWSDYGDGTGGWHWSYDGDAPTANPPTHWMPLPAAPSTEGGA